MLAVPGDVCKGEYKAPSQEPQKQPAPSRRSEEGRCGKAVAAGSGESKDHEGPRTGQVSAVSDSPGEWPQGAWAQSSSSHNADEPEEGRMQGRRHAFPFSKGAFV